MTDDAWNRYTIYLLDLGCYEEEGFCEMCYSSEPTYWCFDDSSYFGDDISGPYCIDCFKESTSLPTSFLHAIECICGECVEMRNWHGYALSVYKKTGKRIHADVVT